MEPHVRTYDLDYRRWIPVNSSQVRLENGDQTYRAAVMAQSPAHASQFVGDWAAARGMSRVERQLQNRYGERLRQCNAENPGKVIYVSKIWSGRPLQMTSEDVTSASEALAGLHASLDDCGNLGRTELTSLELQHGKWMTRLHNAGRRFAPDQWGKERDRGSPRLPFDWNNWLHRWEDLAQRAIAGLEELDYGEWYKKYATLNSLAWNQYRLQNLTTLDGRIGIQQSHIPVLDSPLYDLATLCIDFVEQGQGDGALEAVENYSLYRRLTGQDVAMVLCFVAFPHQGLRTVYQQRLGRLHEDSVGHWRESAELQFSAGERLLEKVEQWRGSHY